MKNLFLLLILIVCSITNSIAQKIPAGMKYQAVARNSSGEVLPSKNITLRIELKGSPDKGGKTYYSEEHAITTNQLGLFDLVVGEGKCGFGVFNSVPWSSEDVWMAVSLKEKGVAFSAVTESRLLAVPYAFHAATAGRLMDNLNAKFADPDPGVPANVWSLQGNIGSDASKDRLGTTDYVDLVIITNNLERMRILANGDIIMKRSLSIGANLTVDSSAYLNKTAGETINYGPLTVDRQSPTLLSGTLTVDGATDLNNSLNVDGPTDLNSRLFVNNLSPSKLTGTLQVDGVTDLNNSFFVNNISPSVLTGTLRVDKDANFKEFVLLDGDRATHESTSTTTGALVVFGGFGLGGNLNVGGESAFGGPVKFAAAVSITDLTESTSTTTGALIVGGGVGIGKRLNVGGDTKFESNLGVIGLSSFDNTTESTAFSNGAIVSLGGVGIAKNLNIGGAFTSVGAATLGISGPTPNYPSKFTVHAASDYAASFKNTGANGVSIQVGATTPNGSNDFVTFRNGSGGVVGRIEGQTLAELNADSDYINDKNAFIFSVVTSSVDLAIAGFEVAQGVVDVIAAASSSTACVGLGVCVTAPIPSFIIAAGTSLVLKIANVASEATSLAGAIVYRDTYVSNRESQIGVTYQSGSADYAEWLPKSNKTERFMAGYIVGMKNGTISLNTQEADKLFAISTKPIVLGNMPEAGNEANFEKVAFMGQVPVHVFGKVKTGDYILPSGKNNGFGIAVTPANMKAEDYDKIVGVAWSESKSDGYGQVNVAIGLNSGEISRVVTKQNKEIVELKSKIKETNSILAKLVPGFAKEARLTAEEIGGPIASNVVPVVPSANVDNHTATHSTAGNIVYFEITRDQELAMFAMAEKLFVENGGDVNTHPFWSKMKTDPSYRESMMVQVQNKFKTALHTHQEINNKYLGNK